ncbi:hypothetical protein B9479_003082 [Cryptococcus floricola]|uniref:Uncharacterized protein n=1 Tax=Cryptococcus floricola TaxID=2591691 RepID=A0A5D3AXP9_9TREE|nr:hypothetical protein B9479_003082 [Cryptococcus floricola]
MSQQQPTENQSQQSGSAISFNENISANSQTTQTMSKATADSISFKPERTDEPQNWVSTAAGGYVYTGTKNIDPNRPWHQPNE